MKFFKTTFLFLFIGFVSLTAQQRSFMSYYELSDFYLAASPGAYKFGLYGYGNPAITSYLHDFDMQFTVSDQNKSLQDFNRWGLFTGTPYSGFGLVHLTDSGRTITDYRMSFAFGSKDFSLGLGYGFTGGAKSDFRRSNIISWGALIRPMPYLSVGFHQTYAIDNTDVESVADIGIRPVKNYPLTLFGDYAMFNNQNLDAGRWSAGVSYEFLDGIRVNGRYFEEKNFAVGVEISFGRMGVASQAQFDNNGEYGYNSYTLRLGAPDRTFFRNMNRGNDFVKLDMSGSISYQRRGFLDNSTTLMDLFDIIDKAAKENSVRGLILNLSDISANKEILWELREKLKEFKASGKKIYAFVDRLGLEQYHLASIADKIIMDAQGGVGMSGYILGRSFYKSMLDKVDIGFEELRYFKYKSAYENFARKKMSEADREQRQALVDDWYETSRTEVCAGRGFSGSEFDDLVNGSVSYLPKEAMSKRLVDTLGRWPDADEVVKKLDGSIDKIIDAGMLAMRKEPFDDKWSNQSDKIAIIYAVGECAMESGINARQLVKDVQKAVNDNSIKAIVLRVDSPGGDPMASDYIAKVIRDNKYKKPIIVSQGVVAGSGGYWLSMDADTIVSSPMTITGSIGVIGAWIYDKGLKDTLGIAVETVKKGKYADLGYSYALPFIGVGLPVRNLTEDERSQMEGSIKTLYQDFVDKVAASRNMPSSVVDSLGQGRVWSGTDARANGLVDELGGLSRAIEIAKDAARIPRDREIEYVEYPVQPWFDLSMLFNQLTGVNIKDIDYRIARLKSRLENNGVPMPMMPIEYYDFVPEK